MASYRIDLICGAFWVKNFFLKLCLMVPFVLDYLKSVKVCLCVLLWVYILFYVFVFFHSSWMHYKRFKFSLWFNKFKIYYKTVEKSGLTKSMLAKSFSMDLGVEQNKKINAYLSIKIKIILYFFPTVLITEEKMWWNVMKSETFLHYFFIRGGEKLLFCSDESYLFFKNNYYFTK